MYFNLIEVTSYFVNKIYSSTLYIWVFNNLHRIIINYLDISTCETSMMSAQMVATPPRELPTLSTSLNKHGRKLNWSTQTRPWKDNMALYLSIEGAAHNMYETNVLLYSSRYSIINEWNMERSFHIPRVYNRVSELHHECFLYYLTEV